MASLGEPCHQSAEWHVTVDDPLGRRLELAGCAGYLVPDVDLDMNEHWMAKWASLAKTIIEQAPRMIQEFVQVICTKTESWHNFLS